MSTAYYRDICSGFHTLTQCNERTSRRKRVTLLPVFSKRKTPGKKKQKKNARRWACCKTAI